MTDLTKATGHREGKSWAIRHAAELAPLLHADNPVLRKNLPDATAYLIHKGYMNGAILKAGRVDTGGEYVYLWELNPKLSELVQDHLESAELLPCGHTGIRNLRDGKFSCTVDKCDDEFSLETVEEVFG